jgi:ABC-type branched-subunit amino acid transport system permease subunit
MFSTMSIVTQETLSRVARYAVAVLFLTSVHHAYGAFAYNTPWRLHAVFLSAFAAAAIVCSMVVTQRSADETVREIAFWVFTAVVLLVPVALIGLFEGAYNHALKNALYFAGASSTLMNRLFPPPTYELPNDVFFEATGVMQAVLGSITAWLLHRLVSSRFGRIVVAPKDASSDKRIQVRG